VGANVPKTFIGLSKAYVFQDLPVSSVERMKSGNLVVRRHAGNLPVKTQNYPFQKGGVVHVHWIVEKAAGAMKVFLETKKQICVSLLHLVNESAWHGHKSFIHHPSREFYALQHILILFW
jgi:hypothetical protein